MNDPARLQLFEDGLRGVQSLKERWPDHSWLPKLADYIRYLSAVETGAETDRSRIHWAGFGAIAARDIEDRDFAIAETFYAIAAAARDMAYEQ